MGIGTSRETGGGITTLDSDRKDERDNAIRSQVLTLTTGSAEALYTLSTDPARTSGKSLYIYVITVHCQKGGDKGQVGLEQPVGTEIYPRITVDDEETAVVCLETPIPVGATGVFAKAYNGVTLVGVDVQILGLEV